MTSRTACPHCGAPTPVSATGGRIEPSVHCPACGYEFFPSEGAVGGAIPVVHPRSGRGFRRPRRRPRPDPAAGLYLPGKILFSLAALEFVIVAIIGVGVLITSKKQLANGFQNLPEGSAAALIWAAATLVRDVVVVLGARQMLRRRSFALALIGALAAVVPLGCVGPPWMLLGLWAVYSLCQPHVPARFGWPPPPWPPPFDARDDLDPP